MLGIRDTGYRSIKDTDIKTIKFSALEKSTF